MVENLCCKIVPQVKENVRKLWTLEVVPSSVSTFGG
jgi:hypothetical protein